jgi:hypothetical protein
MKVNVEIDCSPEEARRFMGLPDVAKVQDAYMTKMADIAKAGPMTGDMVEAIVKNLTPMGDTGMKLWQTLFEQATKPKPRTD